MFSCTFVVGYLYSPASRGSPWTVYILLSFPFSLLFYEGTRNSSFLPFPFLTITSLSPPKLDSELGGHFARVPLLLID